MIAMAFFSTLATHLPAAETGDFTAAYSYAAASQTRSSAPSSDTMAGIASFGLFLRPDIVVAGSTQTFTSATAPGSPRTWSYGVTKLEASKNFSISPKKFDIQLDYTITLPTDGSIPAPGVETLAHQYLAMFDYQRSDQHYFEVDVGDYMGGRDSLPGYKHTGLLSLIAERNQKKNGSGRNNFLFEVDASPSSEGAPASAIFTTGLEHSFKSKIGLVGLVSVGLTANDPAIAFSLKVKFNVNLRGREAPSERALTLQFRKSQGALRWGFPSPNIDDGLDHKRQR